MGGTWSTSSIGNTSNETDISCNSDVYRLTSIAPPSDDQPGTSKLKMRVLLPANESSRSSTQTAKPYDKYQFDNEISQQA